MKKLLLLSLFVFVMSCQAQNKESAIDADDINKAIESTNQWLGLVDSSHYGESWENSSDLFQNAITKSSWIETLEGIRTPLGKMITREIESKQYATSLPNAPEGEYVVIIYKTEFENRENSIETVTPMKDKDGKWRVSGYYIR